MMLYTPEWLAEQEWTREWVERALLGVFAHLGVSGTLTDLGCGAGYAVALAQRIGVAACGYDIATLDGFPQIWRTDLTRPIVPLRSDLVLSWEVGEHLPPEAADLWKGA